MENRPPGPRADGGELVCGTDLVDTEDRANQLVGSVSTDDRGAGLPGGQWKYLALTPRRLRLGAAGSWGSGGGGWFRA